jgi:hypothetical protein
MDRAMGAFLAVVAVPRINKLRVINTLNSSTPAASTSLYFQQLTVLPTRHNAWNKLSKYDFRTWVPFPAAIGDRFSTTSRSLPGLSIERLAARAS